ncbi:MAG: peptidoglycan editing factor PgeF [Okeania sp. SIO3I5]|uniref:peptidoglycan editing factor PgeF n=1 Tax=Okeania sp. SIO3I5 TaxID=2607805 RepID=UPI0013B88BA9|nr:peptidoglycan editing factor PgeF [Okeania sp. SIO3I5]NEQ38372.1 peptidoglycan editing factor PgeF [Okeania sp. SIO3I5]
MTIVSSDSQKFNKYYQGLSKDDVTWHWQEWQGLPYLTCSLLQNWPHGFFTHHFFPNTPTELIDILNPSAEVFRVKQVHGNTVLTAGKSTLETEANYAEADGLLTEKAKQAVWVCTADCVPVLIADQKTGQVAAVHAGWRGTAAKIVPVALAGFEAHGSQLSDLLVVLGPAIAGEVYQVSEEVAAQVGVTIFPETGKASIEEILHFLELLPNSPILSDPEPGKVRLDVRLVNILQLEKLGIGNQQVAIAPYCTYQQPDYFFSYRREKQKKVQWSGIVSVF